MQRERNLTDRQENYLDICMALLDERQSRPDKTYWFCGENDDEGESLCYDCIHAVPRVPVSEYGDEICSGAYGESDGSEHCQECGKLLSYTLTDYGVNSEMRYFLDAESKWDWNSPDDCFELARIAHAVYTVAQKRDLIKVLRKGKNKPKIDRT